MTITITGSCQKTCVRTKSAKNVLETTIHELCRTIFASPAATRNVPSVARIASIPISAVRTPFRRPMPAEARIPAGTASHRGSPCRCARSAATTDPSSTFAPTERSRPPLSITIVSPIAATATTVIWTRMFRRLAASRKTEEVRPKTRRRSPATASVPNASASGRIRSAGVSAGAAADGALTAISGVLRRRALCWLPVARANEHASDPGRARGGRALRKRRLWGSRGKRLFPPCQEADLLASPPALHREQEVLLGRHPGIELGGERPAVDDEHPVGEPQHLGQIRRDDEDARAVSRQPLELAVDLDLGTDVDAARRLDADEQAGAAKQPSREER